MFSKSWRSLLIGAALGMSVLSVQAADIAADAFVRQVSGDVIDAVKADKAIQAGDLNKIISLVDAKVMPHVNFTRMTRIAVGNQQSIQGFAPARQALCGSAVNKATKCPPAEWPVKAMRSSGMAIGMDAAALMSS